jgi:hypothetical protein
MKNKKLMLAVAGAFGLILSATASFAGPLMLGPAPVPVIHTAPVVHVAPVQAHALQAYRQLRTFWLSRAIVR